MKDRSMTTDYEVLMKIIKGRRSVRRFKAEAVEREKIRMLIEAARWAPSAGNAQPWEFVIISNRNIIDKLKTIMTGVMGNIKEGPVLICICVNKKIKTSWTGFDIGCALQNILLCAYALGLGACAIGGFDELMTGELLDLPDHLEPCLFVTLGYPEKDVSVLSRKDITELIVKEVGADE